VGQIRCLICLGEYPEAVTWGDRALERFPGSADLLACKGMALVLLGDGDQGREYLDGAVQLRAPSTWVWLARGESLLVMRQSLENARRCFLKATELAPQDWHLQLRIGMAYNRAHMFSRAREPLLTAVQGSGDNPLALFHLGVAVEGLGQVTPRPDGMSGRWRRHTIFRKPRRRWPGLAARVRSRSSGGA